MSKLWSQGAQHPAPGHTASWGLGASVLTWDDSNGAPQAGVRAEKSPASAPCDDTHLQADEGEGDPVPVEVPYELLEPQHHGVVDAADVRALQNRAARGGCCGDTCQPVTRGGGGCRRP